MIKPARSRRPRANSEHPAVASIASGPKPAGVTKKNPRRKHKSSSSSPAKRPPTASALSVPRKKEPFAVRFMSFAQRIFEDNPFARRASVPRSPDRSHRPAPTHRRARPHPVRNASGSSPSPDRSDSKSASDKTREYKNPILRARVSKGVLEGGDYGPFRPRFFSRMATAFRPKTAVPIEPLEVNGMSTAVLFASEDLPTDSRYPFAPTQLISGRPRRNDNNLVYRDNAFEIRVAGMLVRNFDKGFPGPSGDNELLLYSVQTDPTTTGDNNQSLPYIHFDHQRDGNKNSERPNTYVPIPASKSYVLGSAGVKRPCKPEIEKMEKSEAKDKKMTNDKKGAKDKKSNGSKESKEKKPNGDKQSKDKKANGDKQSKDKKANGGKESKESKDRKENSKKNGTTRSSSTMTMQMPMQMPTTAVSNRKCKRSVNVQFRILELDEPNETVKQAINGIDQLGGYVSGLSSAAPFLGILSPALALAGAVSKRALDSYARPDKVMSIDMDFLLADRQRVRNGEAPPGEYLRYGYYFFLSEPVEGKLYASVQTPKNVQLMLRRYDKERHHTRGQSGTVRSRKFFPLTEISYLVVRVCEPTYSGNRNRKPIQMSHATQLEEIFKSAKSSADPAKVKAALGKLGKDIGVFESDTESEMLSR